MVEDLTRAVWLRRGIVAALLAGLVILAFQVLQPFIVPVIWSVILAYASWPLHQKVVKLFGGARVLPALLMTLFMAALILLPIVYLVTLMQTEVLRAYQGFSELLARGPQLPSFILELPMVGAALREWLASVAADPASLDADIRGLVNRFAGEVGPILGLVGTNIAKLIISLVSLFFMYRDGEKFAAQVAAVLEQFLGGRVHGYIDAIGDTVKAVVYGLFLAAIAQGTLAGIGYYFAGLNAPVFLGALTTLCALIPFVVPVMWGGASLWLLLSGDTVAALGLFLWGALAVSWIDNVVRPLVISGATKIPFLLVMFGVLGGLASFGLVGLFIGPVILAVLMAIWREWLAEKRAAEEPGGSAAGGSAAAGEGEAR